MSDSRWFRWAATTARLALGAVVVAAFVLGVVAGAAAPWPQVEHEPVSVTATPAPRDAVAVCGGPVLAAGRVAEDAAAVTAAADPVLIAATSDAVPVQTLLSAPDVQNSTGVAVFTAAPVGRNAVALAAAASATLSDDDLTGFTADACRPPLLESWLVGGSTSTGASDLLILSNPGDVTATVQLTVFGASGPVVPPGGADLLVAAGTQRVLPLAGVALGEASPVVRVTATGSPVRASLQSSLVRTIVPGGVDIESAIATPDPVQVIPGVRVTEAPGEDGASDAATLVRLLAPAAAGTASISVVRVGSFAPALDAITVPLEAGQPAEVELSGLPIGEYVVTVEASAAVLAAVWQTTGFGAGADFAWLTSAPPLRSASIVAVPDGPEPTLYLVNRSDLEVIVSLQQVGGDLTRDVVVPAGGSIDVVLPVESVWLVEAAEGLHASISYAGADALAGFALWPDDAAAEPIVVYP